MRIDEELKLAGYFWLPSDRDKKIAGTLNIKNGGELELEIIGHFKDELLSSNEEYELSRIIGHVEKLGTVTLENCFYKTKNYSFGGISKSTIYVQHALVGIEYELDEPTTFNSISFSIDGLEEWVAVSGISVERANDFSGTKITFDKPEPLKYLLKNDLVLQICFGYSMPGQLNPINLEIKQNTYFKLTSPKTLPLDDFIFIAHKFVTLMSFAMDAIVSIKNMHCFSNEITREVNENKRPEPIQLFYESEPFDIRMPELNRHTMLFRFADIKGRFNEIVDKWLEAYEAISPTLNLYFSTKTGAQKYLDGKFLALTQALETYHRRTSIETYTSKKDYKDLLNEIKSKCPENHKKWLAGRLDNGNEISLRERLNRIVESFKSNIGTDDEVELIIKLIVYTRNYLTHYNPKLENKAASGQNLWNLCQKMEAILQLHLLKALGFNDAEISSVLDNTYKFKNKLQQTTISTS